jgi:hypothetical protein
MHCRASPALRPGGRNPGVSVHRRSSSTWTVDRALEPRAGRGPRPLEEEEEEHSRTCARIPRCRRRSPEEFDEEEEHSGAYV